MLKGQVRNIFPFPVYGMSFDDTPVNRERVIIRFKEMYDIDVLPEHYETFMDDNGYPIAVLTYNAETLAPVYPLATNQLKG